MTVLVLDRPGAPLPPVPPWLPPAAFPPVPVTPPVVVPPTPAPPRPADACPPASPPFGRPPWPPPGALAPPFPPAVPEVLLPQADARQIVMTKGVEKRGLRQGECLCICPGRSRRGTD